MDLSLSQSRIVPGQVQWKVKVRGKIILKLKVFGHHLRDQSSERVYFCASIEGSGSFHVPVVLQFGKLKN
jgi:hypothetical protein